MRSQFVLDRDGIDLLSLVFVNTYSHEFAVRKGPTSRSCLIFVYTFSDRRRSPGVKHTHHLDMRDLAEARTNTVKTEEGDARPEAPTLRQKNMQRNLCFFKGNAKTNKLLGIIILIVNVYIVCKYVNMYNVLSVYRSINMYIYIYVNICVTCVCVCDMRISSKFCAREII